MGDGSPVVDSVSVRGLSANPMTGKTADRKEEASREAQEQGGIIALGECLPAVNLKGIAIGVSAPERCSSKQK